MCSCHFQDGKKENNPTIFKRNLDKLFPVETSSSKKQKTKPTNATERSISLDITDEKLDEVSMDESVLRADLSTSSESNTHNMKEPNGTNRFYSLDNLNEEIIRMETGIPTKNLFLLIVAYAKRFKDDISYFYDWRVESIKFEDQILITLMKLRQNYTNLHLAKLFSCSKTTISNIVLTFIHVLHKLLFVDLMSHVPSRFKNGTSAPAAFADFPNCRMIVDCTDIEVVTPKQMDLQRLTYSTYRSMNSFKALVGVAPNGVITFISKLYVGSTSDKHIVQKCGILNHFVAGDLILADKGFLIQNIVPAGVSVNIPPFLEHGKLSKHEIVKTKSIAKCRIHVERANARLKSFKILTLIPSWLRGYADVVFQLVAALVNLQFPLIKEAFDDSVFE